MDSGETVLQERARLARTQNITIPDNLDPDALIVIDGEWAEDLAEYGAEQVEDTGRWAIALVSLARYIVDDFDDAAEENHA